MESHAQDQGGLDVRINTGNRGDLEGLQPLGVLSNIGATSTTRKRVVVPLLLTHLGWRAVAASRACPLPQAPAAMVTPACSLQDTIRKDEACWQIIKCS
jgi:hypothetical protein